MSACKAVMYIRQRFGISLCAIIPKLHLLACWNFTPVSLFGQFDLLPLYQLIFVDMLEYIAASTYKQIVLRWHFATSWRYGKYNL